MPKQRGQRPLAMVEERCAFKGLVRISDFDACAKFVKYRGDFVCNNCGGKGSQIMTAWKDKWQEGISGQEVEVQMQESILRNHVCRLPIH